MEKEYSVRMSEFCQQKTKSSQCLAFEKLWDDEDDETMMAHI